MKTWIRCIIWAQSPTSLLGLKCLRSSFSNTADMPYWCAICDSSSETHTAKLMKRCLSIEYMFEIYMKPVGIFHGEFDFTWKSNFTYFTFNESVERFYARTLVGHHVHFIVAQRAREDRTELIMTCNCHKMSTGYAPKNFPCDTLKLDPKCKQSNTFWSIFEGLTRQLRAALNATDKSGLLKSVAKLVTDVNRHKYEYAR